MPALVQRLGKGKVATVGPELTPGVMGEQRGDITRTLGQRHVVGDRHHPQPQRRQLGLDTRELQKRRTLVRRRHEHDLHVGRRLECRLDSVSARKDRVHRTVERGTHLRTSDSDNGQ